MSRGGKRSVYKVVLLGDGGVGKTSLVSRYFDRGFDASYKVTLGADFNVKKWRDNVIQIWDLAGQDLFAPVRRSYYASAIGALLLFDVANPQSFKNLDKWVEELSVSINERIPIMVVANKIDLRALNENCIKEEEAMRRANSFRIKYKFPIAYTETSALNGLNIDQIFEDFINWGILGEGPGDTVYHRPLQSGEEEEPEEEEVSVEPSAPIQTEPERTRKIAPAPERKVHEGLSIEPVTVDSTEESGGPGEEVANMLTYSEEPKISPDDKPVNGEKDLEEPIKKVEKEKKAFQPHRML